MLITLRGRLAFPSLWTPSSVQNGPEKYRARIIIDPADKATVKLIRDTRVAVAKEKWKGKADGIMAAVEGDRHKETWFESDYLNDSGDVYDGFEGMYHLSALADQQPTIIDRDRTELSKRDGRPYSGCYCVFKVDIWAQDNASGKAMRAGLAGVQFWKDGDGFGGGVRAKIEDFEDLSNLGEDDTPSQGRGKAAKDEERSPPPRGANKRRAAPVEEDDDIG